MLAVERSSLFVRGCIVVLLGLGLAACAGGDGPGDRDERYDVQLGQVAGAEVPFLVRVAVAGRADAAGVVAPENLPQDRLRARVQGLTRLAEETARRHCAPLRPRYEPDPAYIVALDPAQGAAGTRLWRGGNPAPFMIELAYRCGA